MPADTVSGRRPTAPGAVGLDQIDQCLPRHDLVHARQDLLGTGGLPGFGLVVVSETEALAR